MTKIIRNILFGIGWGCTVFVILGMIFAGTGSKELVITSSEFISQAICSMIVGVGFTLPAMAYNNDKISRGLQILIHMGIGLTVYFIVGFYAGWIPVECGLVATIITITMIIIISFIIWYGFYIYNKIEASKINEKLKDK